jgi:hypothetical protein
MQYVLGNMLNGGGINPDGLSLDLQFAADKTLTARRGPTPTFTRSSGDNGGTTYFGPLVDSDLVGEIPATGITNERALWFISEAGDSITIYYTGTRWSVITVIDGIEDEYLAAPGSEWRPDQADWSGVEFSITTSSTFGIVKAANNEPRFDHDPASPFACRGLLIEEGRTNLLARSEEFNQSPWSSTLATVTPDDGVSPDGLTTAESFLFTGTGSVIQTASMGSTAPTATFSFFVKAKTGAGFTRILIGNGAVPTSFFGGWFNLSTGLWATTATGGTATLIGTSVTNLNNGWYRISIAGSVSGTSSYSPFLYITDSDNTTTRSSTVSQFWWGAQLEAGSFATSYIPTTTGTLARSADVCSITGGNFNNFYNQSEGTLFAGCTPQSVTQIAVVVGVNTTTFLNSHFIYKSDSTANVAGLRWVGASPATPPVTIPSTTDVATTFAKIAYAYKSGSFAMAYNNILAGTSSSTLISNPTAMRIGARDGGLSINGHISEVRYYKKRLPNAKLQALTV